ncbi:CD225/dispanin family protein [Arenimonas composti]
MALGNAGAPPPPPGYGGSPAWPNQNQAQGPKPDNYLVWAIIVTICCCLPGGIVSIVYAAQVDSKYNAGDYAGARDASDKAKLWALISAGVGFVFSLIYVGLNFAAIAGQSGNF